jgi:hypothetical protein
VHARAAGNPQPIVLAEQGAFPQLIAVPDGPVLAAWENKGRFKFNRSNSPKRERGDFARFVFGFPKDR